MAPLLRAFGVAATVTRPSESEGIEATGVWLPLDTMSQPDGSPWQRNEELKCIAFDVDEVPTCPKGTLIEAPERRGDDPKIWIVDGLANTQATDRDQVKVIVRFYAEAGT